MFERSHKLTRIFTKLIFSLKVNLLLTIAIIRGYSCQFVVNYFLKGHNHMKLWNNQLKRTELLAYEGIL